MSNKLLKLQRQILKMNAQGEEKELAEAIRVFFKLSTKENLTKEEHKAYVEAKQKMWWGENKKE